MISGMLQNPACLGFYKWLMNMMTYEETMDFIHGTYKFGIKLGLENMRELLRILGEPQNSMKYVHVAGTNGKGSAVSFMCSILEDAGYVTGKYVSPFIERFSERISVNGVEIGDEDLAVSAEKVKNAVEIMVANGFNHPTEFEVVTAIAFVYFREKQCDYAVLEVGMGGRFDSTNVIERPEVCIITNVDMDHMSYLGDTLEKIAAEKAGIIKKGCPVVLSAQSETVEQVVAATAEECRSPLTIARPEDYVIPELRLLGGFQKKNAASVIAAARIMGISENYIDSGLRRTEWPGRLEKCGTAPDVYVDGAHNPAAARVLVDSLTTLYPRETRYVFIIGMMADKDIDGALKCFSEIAHSVITVTPDNPRAISAEKLALKVGNYCKNVTVSDTIINAMSLARKQAGPDDVIIACGSLYYIGEARRLILDGKA